ncbi:MAG: hypothetical protein MUE74_08400, partial [Bacteroidales bacterium]|nr:hypothetical protein [Bacteroidales bacterium]
MKNLAIVLFLLVLLSSCGQREKTFIASFEGKVSGQTWAIKDLNKELPSDWSAFNYLTFDLNASSTQRFFLKLHDEGGIRRLRRVQPFQGAWVRASIPLVHFQQKNVVGHDLAAIGKKPLPGLTIGLNDMVGSITNIDSMGFIMEYPIGNPTIEFRNVRLTMEPEDSILSPVPLVDEFGQWIPAEWPGKAKTIEDLRAAWAAEESSLQPGNFNTSEFGGFLSKKVKASGFFRIEKIEGKWWLVDPEGYVFFSTGSCGMRPGGSFSRVEGREYIFAAFPPAELVSAERRIGKGAFNTWNVYRRFGDDYYRKGLELIAKRMDSWGLNTVGNWSDQSIGREFRKAYMSTLGGWGFDAKTMGLPDVYNPDYASMVDAAAKRQCEPLKNDPYLLGYFVGNEPAWPGRELELAEVILKGDASPIQTALKTYLEGGDTPERRKTFIYDTYIQAIKTINAAIRKYDPNHLNMGLRFGSTPPEELTVASAGVGFDVYSINVYDYSIPVERLNSIDRITGLPVIVGEFHFGAPERGLAPGLGQTR